MILKFQSHQQGCLANNSRCQSRQHNQKLIRQASAGSLPPDHSQQHLHSHHHHHPSHVHHSQHTATRNSSQGQDRSMYQANSSSYDDGGYKSDGEAYQVCYNNHHHNHNRVRHNTGGAATSNHHSHSHQRPIRSLSGQMIHEPNTHQSSGRNGYLSDGEGYIIQNQRVSRSGKYGSQASSPRSDRQLMHHPDDSEEESDEDEDEEDEEEEEDLEDNIEAEIHMNDMKEEKPGVTTVQSTTQQQSNNPGSNQADLIVSYSAFQAEALAAGKNHHLPGSNSSSRRVQSIPAYLGKEQLFTMHAVTTTETATVRRSNSNNENSRMQQQSVPSAQPTSQSQVQQQPSENGQRSSRRSSRSNSRQGDSVDSGTGTGRQVRGGGASSSQSDHRSDGGYKSDGWYQQRSQPPQPSTKRPDGYRSEGSTESPKHHEVQHMTMTDGRGGTRSAACRRNHHQGLPGAGGQAPTHHMRTSNKHMPPPMPPTGGHFTVPQNSRSLQSFSRQESTGSFYSSHSAPGCGRHPHGLHSHAGHHSAGSSSSAAQVQPRQQQNLESCSTQSSSSSASAGPPDYNACAGAGGSNPPSYEQAKRRGGNPPEVPPKVPPHGNSKKKSGLARGNSSQRHHHFSMPVSSKSSSSRGAGSNELYYMGEFYG